ncbi:MAG: hypothetical protein AAF761_09125 [Pseudomonadota bacterium]
MAAASTFGAPGFALDLNVVGSWSNSPLHISFEAEFWSKKRPAAGVCAVELTTHN